LSEIMWFSVDRLPKRRILPSLLLLPLFLLVSCSDTPDTPSMDEYLTRVTELGSYDENVRKQALLAIRASPPKPTKAALRSILKGEVPGNWTPLIRVTIAALLATWEDEETGEIDKSGLPELIEALRGPDVSLRRLAVETLPLIGTDAVNFVLDVLKSGQTENRMDAAVVLGRMLQREQNAAAGRALLSVNLQEEPSAEVRMAVMINLAEWKSREAVDGFIAALTDPDEQVRAFAWQQVKEREKPPVEFEPKGEIAKRTEQVQKIRAWWQGARKKKARKS